MRCAFLFCFTDVHTAPSSARSPPQFQITTNAVPESRKQHKHVRARQPLSSDSRDSPTVASDESSSQSTAIWFPPSSRPTSQRNATESTGTHCRASLYRDVSGAGKPAPVLRRSAKAFKPRPRLFGFGLREGLDADLFFFFFLVRAQRNRDCSQSYCAWRQPTKVWTPQI